jgi:hypothetical protein
MQIKDRHDFIAAYGQHAVCILGNVENRDYEVLDLAAGPLGPEYHANFAERGLGYIGVFALIEGQFRYAYAVPLDADVTIALAENYARFVLSKLTNPSSNGSGDGAEWLSKLYSLPDTREN